MRRVSTAGVALGAVLAATGLSGCLVESGKGDKGDHFKMATPFGNVQVKTDEAAVQSGIGISVYPGATLLKNDKNSGSADINLSLGNMRLRVKALSFRTGDTPEQVRAFYSKELERFGPVITCSGHTAVGTPVRTPEGLSCADERNGKDIDLDKSDGALELKTGSEQHQHLVSIEKEGGGAKFAMVLLDLPLRLTMEGSKGGER